MMLVGATGALSSSSSGVTVIGVRRWAICSRPSTSTTTPITTLDAMSGFALGHNRSSAVSTANLPDVRWDAALREWSCHDADPDREGQMNRASELRQFL